MKSAINTKRIFLIFVLFSVIISSNSYAEMDDAKLDALANAIAGTIKTMTSDTEDPHTFFGRPSVVLKMNQQRMEANIPVLKGSGEQVRATLESECRNGLFLSCEFLVAGDREEQKLPALASNQKKENIDRIKKECSNGVNISCQHAALIAPYEKVEKEREKKQTASNGYKSRKITPRVQKYIDECYSRDFLQQVDYRQELTNLCNENNDNDACVASDILYEELKERNKRMEGPVNAFVAAEGMKNSAYEGQNRVSEVNEMSRNRENERYYTDQDPDADKARYYHDKADENKHNLDNMNR